ncbi:MAG TPA: alpha/beta hydrolase family protein [Bacilli bacterium]
MMDGHPDTFFAKIAHELLEERNNKLSAAGWHSYRTMLLRKLPQLLGKFSAQFPAMAPSTLESVHIHSYTRKLIAYSTAEHLRATAYLLLPDRLAPNPMAILALHGHGDGHKEVVGISHEGAEQPAEAGDSRYFAHKLAMMGHIVIAPEMLGFGTRRWKERAFAGEERYSCYSLATQLLLCGKTLAGLRVFEARRAIDLLPELTGGQARRIGCVGFSGGGMIAALVSALDKRICKTVISGYTNTFQGSIMSVRHCLDNYIPGILKLAEMPDIIGLIAPRPLFVEAGANDPLFPVKHVRQAYSRLTEIYRHYHAERQLALDIFPGKHEFSGRRSLAWLVAD